MIYSETKKKLEEKDIDLDAGKTAACVLIALNGKKVDDKTFDGLCAAVDDASYSCELDLTQDLADAACDLIIKGKKPVDENGEPMQYDDGSTVKKLTADDLDDDELVSRAIQNYVASKFGLSSL